MNVRTLITLALLLGGAGPAAKATQLGVDFSGLGFVNATYNTWSLGFEFQVVTPVTVVGLAAFDNDPGGLATTVPVALWTDSGTLLAATSFAAGTRPNAGMLNDFATAAITPITLAPGFYEVAAVGEYTDGVASEPGFTSASGINFVEDRWANGTDTAAVFPNQTEGGGSFKGFFGGNLLLAVPEATSTLGLLSGSCLVLGLLRSKRVRLRRHNSF